MVSGRESNHTLSWRLSSILTDSREEIESCLLCTFLSPVMAFGKVVPVNPPGLVEYMVLWMRFRSFRMEHMARNFRLLRSSESVNSGNGRSSTRISIPLRGKWNSARSSLEFSALVHMDVERGLPFQHVACPCYPNQHYMLFRQDGGLILKALNGQYLHMPI